MATPLRVLFVEDSEDDALILVHQLKEGDYEPVFRRVETGQALVECLENEPWDIIIADYTLPGFSGLAALKLYKERGLDIPFILVSGTVGEEVAVEAMKTGVHDYIIKNNLSRLVPAVTRELRETAVRRDRQRINRMLQQKEEEYRRIVDTANEGIWVMNGHFETTFVNPRMASMLGYEVEEMVGRKVDSFMFEEDLADHTARMEARQQGLSAQYERRFRRKNGTALWTIVTARALLDEKNAFQGSFGMFTDITDRKGAEKALQESAEHFRLMFDCHHAIMLLIEPESGRIVDANQAAAGFYGYSKETLCSMNIEEINQLPREVVAHERRRASLQERNCFIFPNKPTKLTEIEFSLIKVHPAIGHEVLKEIDFPHPVAPVVLQHHERLDGSGYPGSLQDDEILLESRILAVADVVEVMVSHRPYRPAHGVDVALEEITARRGVLYDSTVVDACLSLFREKGFCFEGKSYDE
jgi:PAS domain S-box-containing protein